MKKSKINQFMGYIFSLKSGCTLIGLLQLSLLILRTYEIVWYYVRLQEPIGIHLQEFQYKVLSGIIQIITIFLLVYGIYSRKPNFILPWLIVTFPVIIIATIYTILGLFIEMMEDSIQIFINCLVLSFVWFAWSMQYKYYNRSKRVSKYVNALKVLNASE